MKVKTKSSQKTHANGVEIEEIDNFKYLGSYITTNGSINMEISTRLAMAAQAFNKLGKIWKSSSLQLRTKLKHYKSNAFSCFSLLQRSGRLIPKLKAATFTET